MKSIAIEGATLNAEELVREAKSSPVILTEEGHPVCAVVGIDELDLEAWSLGRNRRFLALLEKSRERLRDEGGVPLDEVRRRLGMGRKRKPGRARQK